MKISTLNVVPPRLAMVRNSEAMSSPTAIGMVVKKITSTPACTNDWLMTGSVMMVE